MHAESTGMGICIVTVPSMGPMEGLHDFPMSNSKQLYTIIFIFSNDVLKLKLLNSWMSILFSVVGTLAQTRTGVGKVTFLVRGLYRVNMFSWLKNLIQFL